MLRNRSGAVTTKQALMSDHHQTSLLSPSKNNPSSPVSSFLNSPRFLNGFLSKNSETNAMSPTSILDTKHSSTFVNPFGYDKNMFKSPETINKQETQAIGLALVDSIIEEKVDENSANFINRMALIGSKLKVQIPVINPTSSTYSPMESPNSRADFGIKTRALMSPGPSPGPGKGFMRQLSLKEMEMSEDYTCVITHGPNPKTTHIYDDCIVESSSGDTIDIDQESFEQNKEDYGFHETNDVSSPNFLSFCHTCKDVLGQDRDIYIYRGEKAFCSQECRCQEMFFEGRENPELDDDAF